jgi:chaperonin GroES
MTKWRALRCNCIIKIKKGEEYSRGGIIMATAGSREDMAREEGVVIDMGPDMFIDSESGDKTQVRVGDTVAFARYGGKELGKDSEGNELRIMRDIDLLAVSIKEE